MSIGSGSLATRVAWAADCEVGPRLNLLERANVSSWQIVMQKSQNAVRLISRQKPKQAALADRYSLKLVTEVGGEITTR
jgi:hypothetical protein